MAFEVGDARTYRIAPVPSIVGLFNPFDDTILRPFVANNLPVVAAARSAIVYMHDHHARVLEDAGLSRVFDDRSMKVSIWTVGPP